MRLIYTAVVVPDLRGMHAMNEHRRLRQSSASVWRIERPAEARRAAGLVGERGATAGSIVPFGTTVVAVVAKPLGG